MVVANIWIKINEIIIKPNPPKIKILEGSSRLIPLKIKTPPDNPTSNTRMPENTTFCSIPSVNGVNMPDKSAAMAIM